MVLVMDVARFKYPPHWVSLPVLFRAMQTVDVVTGKSRGWHLLTRRKVQVSLLYFQGHLPKVRAEYFELVLLSPYILSNSGRRWQPSCARREGMIC